LRFIVLFPSVATHGESRSEPLTVVPKGIPGMPGIWIVVPRHAPGWPRHYSLDSSATSRVANACSAHHAARELSSDRSPQGAKQVPKCQTSAVNDRLPGGPTAGPLKPPSLVTEKPLVKPPSDRHRASSTHHSHPVECRNAKGSPGPCMMIMVLQSGSQRHTDRVILARCCFRMRRSLWRSHRLGKPPSSAAS